MRRSAFTLVEVLVVIAIIAVLIGLIVPAVMKARGAAHATQCRNGMRELGIAFHSFQGGHETLPAGVSGPTSDMPFVTWMTRILPQMGQDPLWQAAEEAFRLDGDFGQPAHAALLGKKMEAFLCASEFNGEPAMYGASTVAFTNYLGCEGTDQYAKDGMLFLDSKVKTTMATDGTSGTILIGERPISPGSKRFGWWYAGIGQNLDGSLDSVLGAREDPVDVKFGACGPTGNRFRNGKVDNPCDELHFWSYHPGGANFLFCDGSVRFLTYDADKVLPALATRAGNESVELGAVGQRSADMVGGMAAAAAPQLGGVGEFRPMPAARRSARLIIKAAAAFQ